MAEEFYAEILPVLQVHEDHCYVNVIRGCVHRLCADIPVPPIFCVRASTMLQQATENVCACMDSSKWYKQNYHSSVVSATVCVCVYLGVHSGL